MSQKGQKAHLDAKFKQPPPSAPLPATAPEPAPPANVAPESAEPAAVPRSLPRSAGGSILFAQAELIRDEERIHELEGKLKVYEGALALKPIPLDAILPNPHQPRLVMDPLKLDELIASIRDSGQLQPIRVRPAPGMPDRYILVMGGRRCEALRRLGEATVKAEIEEMSEGDAAIASMAENLARDDLCDYEKYKCWSLWLRDGIASSQTEIATRCGVDRSIVVRTMAFGKLPAEVLDVLDGRPNLVSYMCAHHLKVWHEGKHTDLVVEAVRQLAAGKITTQESALDWVRKKLRSPRSSAARSFQNRGGRTVFAINHAPRKLTVTLGAGLAPSTLKSVAEKIESLLEQAALEGGDDGA